MRVAQLLVIVQLFSSSYLKLESLLQATIRRKTGKKSLIHFNVYTNVNTTKLTMGHPLKQS